MHASIPAVILIVVLALSIVALLLFILLVLPIWLLIHCATSTRGTMAKALWMIGMLLCWPLAGFAYGCVAARKPLLQRLSVASLVLALLAGVGLVALFRTGARMVDAALAEWSRSPQLVADVSALPPEALQSLRAQAVALRGELGGRGLRGFSRKERAILTYELLDVMAKDGRVTLEEYRTWEEVFNQRALLDGRALRERIRELRR